MPPNPTGTNYLQASNSYIWTDGDVYQIPQTDLVEGAAPGASFGGLGSDNQPHAALLNKVQLLHNQQLADEANIRNLLQTNVFASAAGLNGSLQISAQDEVLGFIDIFLKWGTIPLLPYALTPPLTFPSTFAVVFPVPYQNAVWTIVPYIETNSTTAGTRSGFSGSPGLILQPVAPLTLQNNRITWRTVNGTFPAIATTAVSPPRTGLVEINWIALGY